MPTNIYFHQVTVVCKLDAFPSNVSFRWRFNNSGEMVDISPEHIRTKDLESSLSYVARTELDYGTLLCWGTNSLGDQTEPCLFRVIPAELPKPPANCTVLNGGEFGDYENADEWKMKDSGKRSTTYNNKSKRNNNVIMKDGAIPNEVVHIRCAANTNIDLPVLFSAIAYNANTNKVIQSVDNSTSPEYLLNIRESVSDIEVAIFSVNKRGTSEKVILRTKASVDIAEKRTAQVRHNPSQAPVLETQNGIAKSDEDSSSAAKDKLLVPLIAVILGVLGSVGFVAVAAVLFAVVKKSSRSTQVRTVPCSLAESPDSNPDVIPSAGKFHLTSLYIYIYISFSNKY